MSVSRLFISPKQAINLELKLNKTEHKDDWSELGDRLYDWRLHPQYNHIDNISYIVSKQQMEWITKILL